MTLRSIFKAFLFAAPLAMAGCAEMSESRAPTTVATPEPAGTPPAQAEPPQQAVAPPAVLQPALVETPVDTSSNATLPDAAVVASGPPQAASARVADTSTDTSTEHSEGAVALGEHERQAAESSVNILCAQIGDKLSSISAEDCAAQQFVFGGGFSVHQRPLVFKEHSSATGASDFRVLIMGGIHGDEYSSISILFKWLALYSPDAVEGNFHWRFVPVVNPDGLLDGGQAKRQNANGVDLNRNFPSRDWNDTAARYWQESTGSNPRRFPGESAASEPEVQWVVQQIEEFKPHVIVSVHAPYHLLDFDGPAEAPAKIGELYLHQLGVYPGSLGNFAGLNRQIPVVTLELPSAGILPPAEQIELMWDDLVAWLEGEGRKNLAQL